MTRVRPATPSDAPEILDLHVASIRAFGPEAYDDRQVAAWADKDGGPDRYPVGEAGHYLAVAERQGSVVGYGHLVAPNDEIRAVYVRPDRADEGVGSAILDHLEARARERGSEGLRLWASRNAVGFYEHHGYDAVEGTTVEKEYEGESVPLRVVKMRKSFEP